MVPFVSTLCMGHGHWSNVDPFLVMTNFSPRCSLIELSPLPAVAAWLHTLITDNSKPDTALLQA